MTTGQIQGMTAPNGTGFLLSDAEWLALAVHPTTVWSALSRYARVKRRRVPYGVAWVHAAYLAQEGWLRVVPLGEGPMRDSPRVVETTAAGLVVLGEQAFRDVELEQFMNAVNEGMERE